MRQTFKTHGNMTKDKKEEIGNEFLIVFRGEIYKIGCDFAVNHPHENYNAIGSGESFALGSLHSTEDTGLTPEERIKLALDAASKYNSYVAPPYEILSIGWTEFNHGDEYIFFDSDYTEKIDKLVNDSVEDCTKSKKKEELETKDGNTSTDKSR
jgi:hypothetical protein